MKVIDIGVGIKFKQLAVLALIAIALVIGKDYWHSALRQYHFYLSESLLFGTYWILFIPFFFLGKYAVGKSNRMSIWILPLIFNLTHIILFSSLVFLISQIFFRDSFQFTPVFTETATRYGLAGLLFYGATTFLWKTVYSKPESQNDQPTASITVKYQHQKVIIDCKDILYLQSETPYVAIIIESKSYLKQISLKELVSKIPAEQFIRIHKSFVVNKAFIASFNSRKNGDYDVILKNGKSVRASRTYRQNFKALLH